MPSIPSGLMDVSPRGRGRPRSHTRHSSVSAWIPTQYHDALVRQADARGKSVSAFVRDVLKDELSKPQRSR